MNNVSESLKNQGLIHKVSQLVNCTPKQFEGIYRESLHHMRNLWQSLCEDNQLDYESLLYEQLCFAKDVLVLRQGFFLPGNPLSLEQMVMEAPQWTYGAFLMACLVKAKLFFMEHLMHEQPLDALDNIIPAGVKQWIAPNKILMNCLAAIYQPRNKATPNPLWNLLDRVEIIRYKENIIQLETADQGEFVLDNKNNNNPLMQLLDWLQQCGKPDKNIVVTKEGLLVSDAALLPFLKKYDLALKVFVELLRPFLLTKKEVIQWRYHASEYDEDQPWIEGMVILSAYLDSYWLSQPLSNAFILIK